MYELCLGGAFLNIYLERIAASVTYSGTAKYTGFSLSDYSTYYTLSANYNGYEGENGFYIN